MKKKEKERVLVGGQTALLIYSEGRGLLASNPPPLLAPSSRVCLLHQPSPALLGSRRFAPPSIEFYRLPPLSAATFYRLPPTCAPVGRDNALSRRSEYRPERGGVGGESQLVQYAIRPEQLAPNL